MLQGVSDTVMYSKLMDLSSKPKNFSLLSSSIALSSLLPPSSSLLPPSSPLIPISSPLSSTTDTKERLCNQAKYKSSIFQGTCIILLFHPPLTFLRKLFSNFKSMTCSLIQENVPPNFIYSIMYVENKEHVMKKKLSKMSPEKKQICKKYIYF